MPEIESTLRIIELLGWSLTQVTFSPSVTDFHTAGHRLCGSTVPARVGEGTAQGATTVLRIAPDRLWILADPASSAFLSPEKIESGIWLLPLTHGRCRFRLFGSRCAELLQREIAIDLDGIDLQPGRVAQTQIHRMPVVVHRREPEIFDLFVSRSFGKSLEHWLADAAVGLRAG